MPRLGAPVLSPDSLSCNASVTACGSIELHDSPPPNVKTTLRWGSFFLSHCLSGSMVPRDENKLLRVEGGFLKNYETRSDIKSLSQNGYGQAY
mmetsp:Transcript_38661/g.61116  ORF Transcript_38661/g.61116 Transcript_38661/m.61116 type:complete len:93 (-) Transcript_38661:8-286(-)